MKAIIKIILVFLPFISALASSQDTLYVMRWGQVAYKVAVKDLDSINYENALLRRKCIVEKMATDNNNSIFYQALVATGLVDSLKADRDKKYDNWLYRFYEGTNGNVVTKAPCLKWQGYTLFVESDSLYRSNGINTLSDLRSYAASVYNQVYPENAGVTDLKDRRNSLNRFIAYHILNKKVSLSGLIDAFDVSHMVKTADMYEYYETLCPNTLMEVSRIRTSGKTNQINRNPDSGNAIQITGGFNDSVNYNGFYYGIDRIMSYNSDVIGVLSNKRLRFDVASLFPELTNNGMRGQPVSTYTQGCKRYYLPVRYIDGLTTSVSTSAYYYTPFDAFLNNEGDEMYFSAQSSNAYDFTITSLPVPAGTYEVRLGYLPGTYIGTAQVFIDSIAAGAPVQFSDYADKNTIGWEKPGAVADDPNGYFNDKTLRNHGYMKGPAGFTVPNAMWYSGPARNSVNYIRKILGTFTFNQAEKHKITITGLCNGDFNIDFIEFVPVSALENEDIY